MPGNVRWDLTQHLKGQCPTGKISSSTQEYKRVYFTFVYLLVCCTNLNSHVCVVAIHVFYLSGH